MTKKILILGGSSFVGRHLIARLGSERTIATYNASARPGMVRFDSTTMDLGDIVSPGTISHAVLLLGDTKPDSCVADPARSRAVNVDAITRIIDRLNDWGIPFTFTSSEFVFDGDKGDYVETDEARPILLYGAQKLDVERYVEATAKHWVTLRLAKVYGEEKGDSTLFTAWADTLSKPARISCAADQRFSPVFVGDVCDAILASVAGKLSGLYHCSGPAGMNQLELLELLVAELRLRRPVDLEITPCSIHDFDLPEKRPLDVSMRPDRLTADAGLALRHPAEACRRIASL